MTILESQVITVLAAGGTLAGDRVNGGTLPQDTAYPAISYSRISTESINDLGGASGLDHVRIQVDCWARTYGEAKLLAVEVRALMQGAPFLGLLENELDDYDEESDLYRVSTDYFCWQQ